MAQTRRNHPSRSGKGAARQGQRAQPKPRPTPVNAGDPPGRTPETVAPPPAAPRSAIAERRARRAAEARALQRQRQRRNLLIGLVVGLIIAAIAGYFLYDAYRNQQLGVSVADEGRQHVNDGTPLTFKHYPPSSGSHYPSPLAAGVYTSEQPEGGWVHSLEHGYVVLLTRCTPADCPDVYAKLNRLFETLPKSGFGMVKFIALPYSHAYTDGDSPFMLLAWNHEMRLDTLDTDIVKRFYNRFVDKGPENAP